MSRNWSPQQLAIFAWFAATGAARNLVVRARAGTGKTTTIIEAINKALWAKKILLCAFNKRIAEELQAKIQNPNGEAKTLHALGFSFIRKNWNDVKVDNDRGRRLAATACGVDTPDPIIGLVAKLACLAKETAPFVTNPDDLQDLQEDFELTLDQEWTEQGYDDAFIRVKAIAAMELARHRDGSIDFSDMLYIPLINNFCQAWYDLVVVDEAQDMNLAQLILAQRACKRGGRIVVVGDDRQCIPLDQFLSQLDGSFIKVENLRQGASVASITNGEQVEGTVEATVESEADAVLRFALDDGRAFKVTPDHICFAAIDDPSGAYLYLMYRPDLGYRIGVTRTVGNRGDNFIVRTAQEKGERLWILEWFSTYNEAAEKEAYLSLRYRVPKEPFKARSSMWLDTDKKARKLFAEFGKNGAGLLELYGLDFDRPNYFAKAGRGNRIAVNLLMGTRDGHRVEVETSHISKEQAEELRLIPTGKGTYRARNSYREYSEAVRRAKYLAKELGAYVVESLACTGSARRMLAVRAASVHPGMLVPVLTDKGVATARVLKREPSEGCKVLDIQVKDYANFAVNGVVVHNCIYSFRGADSSAVDRLKTELKAEELSLNVTYRCPSKIVALAQVIVPDYQAAPTAPEGKVDAISREKLVEQVQPGDFVLSRKNSPLAALCLKTLRTGKRATVVGRDIGAGLIALIKRLGKAKNMVNLMERLARWETREVEKWEAAGKEAKVSEVKDRAETIRELADGLTSVKELETRIQSLFQDNGINEPKVIFSTVHKAKGLEAERVFILRSTLYPYKGADGKVEEKNIEYVAVTRSKDVLVWVEGKF
jgi:hypothetical protein